MRIKDKITLEEKKRQAYEFFVGKGLTPIQASAMVGNALVESNLNTRIEGDKNLDHASIGTFQWRGDRLQRLKSMYSDPYDFNNQLEFAYWELQNTHKHALKALQQAQTPEEAAIAVRAKYEVAWDKHDDRRIQNTKDILEQFYTDPTDQRTVLQKAMDTVPAPTKKIDNTQVTQKVINFPKQADFPTFTGQPEEKQPITTKTDKAKEILESKKNEMQFLKDLLASKITIPKETTEQQPVSQPMQPYGSFILNKAKEVGVFQEGGNISQKNIDDIEQYIKLTQNLGKQRLLEMQTDRTANTWGNMFGNVGQYFFGIEDKDLVESPYRPTVSSDGDKTKYYTRPGMKEDVYNDLVSYKVQRDYNHSDKFDDIYKALLSNGEDREHNADKAFPKNKAGYKGMYNRGHGSFKGEFNLGRYKVDTGEDEKGKYISFYDVYDWNGFQQENKIPFYDRIYEDEWNTYQNKTQNQIKSGLRPKAGK